MNLEKELNRVLKSLEELRELYAQPTCKAEKAVLERMISNYQRNAVDLKQLIKIEKRINNQAE